MKRTLFGAALFLAACGGGKGYLNTDVAEPGGMANPTATGVKIQGAVFQEGILTYRGNGDMQQIFLKYIDAMRGNGWSPSSTEQDPNKGMSAMLVKDTRGLRLDVLPGPEGSVQITIKVSMGPK